MNAKKYAEVNAQKKNAAVNAQKYTEVNVDIP
jgi:hypothetical protein